jgi:hypothetical protein
VRGTICTLAIPFEKFLQREDFFAGNFFFERLKVFFRMLAWAVFSIPRLSREWANQDNFQINAPPQMSLRAGILFPAVCAQCRGNGFRPRFFSRALR